MGSGAPPAVYGTCVACGGHFVCSATGFWLGGGAGHHGAGRKPCPGARYLAAEHHRPVRRRLPDTRDAVTVTLRVLHAVDVPTGPSAEEVPLYVTVGLFSDGSPGEVFLKVDKTGSTLSGFCDSLAVSMSLGLQHGVPIGAFAAKLRAMKFEPSGRTRDPDHPIASSLADYLGWWLQQRFGPKDTA